jgi:hypothetical protein
VGEHEAMVTQKMQRLINKWNQLVGVTGGILAPQKSWWYLVTYKYHKGKWIATDPSDDYRLHIKDSHNQQVDIQRISVNTGINMLGVHLASDGNIANHLDMLRNKADKWAATMTECRANKNEIWTALHRTIPFSIGYSLPAVTFSKEHCRYVMTPIYKCGLPQTGISSTIPLAIRHGPQTMGGLGLMDPYLRMGIGQIESFISNRWLRTPTGTLFEIALDDIALEMGLQDPFSSRARLKQGLGYITTPSWIKHMFTFAADNNIMINVEGVGFHPQRVADKTIMDWAVRYTRHIPTLQSINRVRMYLNVVWLSDIATADGRHLDTRFFTEGTCFPSRNNYRWPMKHHTNTADWRRWRCMARELCEDNNWTLRDALGPWTTTMGDWCDRWDCMVTTNREILYVRTEDGQSWERHIKQPSRRHRTARYYSEFLLYQSIVEPIDQMERASIKPTRTHMELLGCSGQAPWTTCDLSAFYDCAIRGNRHDLLGKLQDTLQLEFLDATEDISKLLQDFSLGSSVSVSDGSYHPDKGRAAGAWVVESSCGRQWIMGAMTVPGPIESLRHIEVNSWVY